MNTTKEQRKEIAIKYMRKLNIYKNYIEDFKNKDWVCLYENFAGFYIWQYEDLQNKLKEIEEKYNCTVYAVTHEFTDLGEIYNFLIVTDEESEWSYLIDTEQPNRISVFAYAWNKNDDFCSEFGTILIQSFGGGIRRIG